jgi:hypothetical protein
VTVRPLIIFVLVGIGISYVLPLAIYFGDVLLTVRRYISRDYGAANATVPMVIYLDGSSTVSWWER